MYSPYLQEYVRELSSIARLDPTAVTILDDFLACFIGVLGRAIGARTDPAWDLLRVSLKLLFLSDGLSRINGNVQYNGAHYLVGLGFEQTGELLARLDSNERTNPPSPLESDHWYRLTLALLHYLAGGHRVQALSVMRHLERIASERRKGTYNEEYRGAAETLRLFYSARLTEQTDRGSANWRNLILGIEETTSPQEARIYRLAQQVRERRDVVLGTLGIGREAEWLLQHGVNANAAGFWASYLRRLSERGITTFTNEQSGPGFDVWLRPGHDMLVVLPTGSGKTIIGELKSALTLAEGRQVIWMLPTRALVRQTKRELRFAFTPLNVEVEELPTTEDFIPLFDQYLPELRSVAATTPEKLSALLRSNQKSINKVGLVVLDEAQILLEKNRGTTAEFVLQEIRRLVPSCDIVLMSAFGDLRETLREFLSKLGKTVIPLESDTRPTRRVYGVITNYRSGGRSYPIALLYPPGIQSESGTTSNAFKIALQSVSLPATCSEANMARRFAKAVVPSRIRTVLFVNRKDSTETGARHLVSRTGAPIEIPDTDTARLRIELGRKSSIESTGIHRVAPHHGGLSPLEQHLVEKWVREGIVSTVVATPTLAQGVNLPFDLSIVSSSQRYSATNEEQEFIPYTDILNMIGRSGRAGYVSDGVGLVAIRRRGTLEGTLDSSRGLFFRVSEASGERVGLARLLKRAIEAQVDAPDWVHELRGMSFTETQSVIHFALDATENEENITEAFVKRISQFPSVQQLQDDEVEHAVRMLEQLVRNIRHQTLGDTELAAVFKRTGLPLEVLGFFLSAIRAAGTLKEQALDDLIPWSYQVVKAALQSCSARHWYGSLVGKTEIESMFAGILMWQTGHPLAEIEAIWQLSTQHESANRIAIGDFINHRLSLFAQFWGALAVCEEIIYRGVSTTDRSRLSLQRLPAFVREGVAAIEELEWLREIGGLDRVLAHYLARTTTPVSGIQGTRSFIRGQLRKWWQDSSTLPEHWDEQSRTALMGVLKEVFAGQQP